jgi:hypothetical protein
MKTPILAATMKMLKPEVSAGWSPKKIEILKGERNEKSDLRNQHHH